MPPGGAGPAHAPPPGPSSAPRPALARGGAHACCLRARRGFSQAPGVARCAAGPAALSAPRAAPGPNPVGPRQPHPCPTGTNAFAARAAPTRCPPARARGPPPRAAGAAAAAWRGAARPRRAAPRALRAGARQVRALPRCGPLLHCRSHTTAQACDIPTGVGSRTRPSFPPPPRRLRCACCSRSRRLSRPPPSRLPSAAAPRPGAWRRRPALVLPPLANSCRCRTASLRGASGALLGRRRPAPGGRRLAPPSVPALPAQSVPARPPRGSSPDAVRLPVYLRPAPHSAPLPFCLDCWPPPCHPLHDTRPHPARPCLLPRRRLRRCGRARRPGLGEARFCSRSLQAAWAPLAS
jgi:hypothetical protein